MIHRLLGTDPANVTGDAALVVLTRAATIVAVPVAALIVLVAFVLRGAEGGVTALVSATVLLGLHVGSGRLVARLAAGKPALMPAFTMLGLLVRLGIYGVLIVIFGDVAGVDVTVLAVTVIALTTIVLAVEARVVARYSKFWWQPTSATPPGADEAAAARPLERTEA